MRVVRDKNIRESTEEEEEEEEEEEDHRGVKIFRWCLAFPHLDTKIESSSS